MKKAFLQLHISILLAGWTGVFGKLMMLSPGLIVFWRIVIAGGCLWLWAWLTKRLEKVTPRDRIAIMGVGALLAVQWTLFYASIKASNVSIGVVAFPSIGFFTALIEPLMNRARISLREMLFSLVTIFGISLIFHFDAQYRLGIALGLVGAAAAALLAVYFKRYRAKYSSVTVMSWQLLGGFAFSCVAIPIYVSLMPPEPFIPTWPDTLYLPIFAIFCTLFMTSCRSSRSSISRPSRSTSPTTSSRSTRSSSPWSSSARPATSVLPSTQASDSSHYPWRCKPVRSCAAGSARSASRPERPPSPRRPGRLKTLETKSFAVFSRSHAGGGTILRVPFSHQESL